MGVVVDTNIWSLFFRRETRDVDREILLRLRELIASGEAWIIGAIRQEVLSGIPDAERFQTIRGRLRTLEDSPVIRIDYERAAEFSNACRARGVQSTPADMLICAVSERLAAPVFTLDGDFARYADVLGIDLYP